MLSQAYFTIILYISAHNLCIWAHYTSAYSYHAASHGRLATASVIEALQLSPGIFREAPRHQFLREQPKQVMFIAPGEKQRPGIVFAREQASR